MGYSNEPEWDPWGTIMGAVKYIDTVAEGAVKHEKDMGFAVITKLFFYIAVLPIFALILVVLSFLKYLFLKKKNER
jgi:signal transduction histidine kinase